MVVIPVGSVVGLVDGVGKWQEWICGSGCLVVVSQMGEGIAGVVVVGDLGGCDLRLRYSHIRWKPLESTGISRIHMISIVSSTQGTAEGRHRSIQSVQRIRTVPSPSLSQIPPNTDVWAVYG